MSNLIMKGSKVVYGFYFSLGYYFSAGYYFCTKKFNIQHVHNEFVILQGA